LLYLGSSAAHIALRSFAGAVHEYWPRINADKDQKDPLTEQVLGTIFEVASALGAGFLEKVYERAPLKELAIRGIRVKSQVPTAVKYKGHPPASTSLIFL
jgi:PD-(D/E)XK nuclease superfamily